jgi:hypothetical protein
VVVGDGPLRAAVEAAVADSPARHRVHLVGLVPHERVPAYLQHADAFVLPAQYEELGSVLVEAMAAGLPVVANDVGGIPDLVTDGVTGRLVERGDLPALAKALDESLADPSTGDRRPGARRAPVRLAGPGQVGARRVRGRPARVSPPPRPRVAVVVPVFEQAAFLGRAIGSLLAQSVTDWEAVVVDDGSTDGPDPMGLPLVRHDANRGLGAALNTGLGATSAPVVAYLPADDAWDADHLEALLAAWPADDDSALVASGVRWRGGEALEGPEGTACSSCRWRTPAGRAGPSAPSWRATTCSCCSGGTARRRS